MCRVGWATTRGNNSRIGDEIKPFFLARLASKYPWLSSVKVPWKMHDRITWLFLSRFRSKKKKRYNPLSLIRFRLERFDSRSFRSAHNSRLDDFSPPDTHISTIYFSLWRWFPGFDLSWRAGVSLSGQRFFSEEERKKKKLMQTRGNKGRGKNGGKSGRTRDQKVKEKPSCATLDIRM